MKFNPDDILEYTKNELIDFWIALREKKKEVEDNIKLINLQLMEEFDIDKERRWDYNVFLKKSVSYSLKKDYDYNSIMLKRPDLFVPSKAKMYKEFPDAIERKYTDTIEMSKDKEFRNIKK